jgi:YbgC/YbaW family acyl-CoA thioester hydrolase
VPLSEHRYARRVQFSEVDSAHIVHFSQYFRYMEEAEHAMWRATGTSIAPHGNTTSGYARIAASFEYHAPLRFEDEFEVVIRVERMTTRTMSYRALVMKGELRIATGVMTVVNVTGEPGQPLRSIPLPDDVLSRFAVHPVTSETAAGER